MWTAHQVTAEEIADDLEDEMICVATSAGKKKLFFKPFPTDEARYFVRDYSDYENDDREFKDLDDAVEAYNLI